ncbi:hypothetical protein [Sphingomonas sp.]|uniref:hypothetical protein n=1 Tax=Sphingomonas sp. TaxID=28214 RepID=UPI003B3A4D09
MILSDRPARRGRRVAVALLLGSLAAVPGMTADPAPFDLPGPDLAISVTRDGRTLPIGEVPGLATGDALTIRADLPRDQRARFLLVAAFLQGATNPPPKKWIHAAETWKPKDKDRTLSLKVPEGARQLILFLIPDTGGAAGTIADNVRGKPGEFVRATQDLNQASLDRSRLNAFMTAIQAQDRLHPEFLKTVAPMLARSLSIKLNQDCLAKVIDLQAACLLENRDTLVLADVHSSSLAETLAGAPTDLALQLSATREAGFGYYSPYIGVIRDVARIFGAFSNPHFDYLPTISQRQGDTVSLLLNAAPSFERPKSVMVVPMPAIEAERPPALRDPAGQPVCLARPGAVLPVEGAPLVYSTAYAREMRLRLTSASGETVDLPVEARADRGGYVVTGDTAVTARLKGPITGQLLGSWGFDPLRGPEYAIQMPGDGGWSAGEDGANLVAGRANPLTLTGGAPACVQSVVLKLGQGTPRTVTWKARGDTGLDLVLPLEDAPPGNATLEVRSFGAKPVTVALRAYRQASRLDQLIFHEGDSWGMLSGQRLDQVARIELGAARLRPDGLTRTGDTDRLRIVGDGGPVVAAGGTARVVLADGRSATVPVTTAPARPRAAILDKSLVAKGEGAGLRLSATGPDVLPDDARLVFSIRAGEGARFLPGDEVEVASEDASIMLSSGPALRLDRPDILVATLDPASLGPSAFGPLRFRVVSKGETGDWQPLATLVRLPRIDAIECAANSDATCTMRGQGLYLIAAVAPTTGFDGAATVPAGYTAPVLSVPAPRDGKLHLRLRDAPDAVMTLDTGSRQEKVPPPA